jgi:hypothetical protein
LPIECAFPVASAQVLVLSGIAKSRSKTRSNAGQVFEAAASNLFGPGDPRARSRYSAVAPDTFTTSPSAQFPPARRLFSASTDGLCIGVMPSRPICAYTSRAAMMTLISENSFSTIGRSAQAFVCKRK